MAFNKFTLSVLFQVLLIAATSFLMVWSFDQDRLVVARFTFVVLWILEVMYLLHYVNKTNRSLSVFLESLRGSDFVRSDDASGSFHALNISYNEIVDVVKGARIEREAQQHYFQYTLELIPVGVLSFNKDDGAIEIYNAAASELMGMSKPSYIDEFDRVKQGLAGELKGMASEASELIEVDSPGGRQRLVVRARMFTLFGREIKLLSFQNIRHELDREEQEAWQKLISVLRHELMNSMGPVNSLSRTLLRMFRKGGRNKRVAELNDKTIDDAVDGLQSIDNRTRGMMRFVQSYRELTRLPAPRKRHVGGAEVLKGVKNLMAEDLQELGIELFVEEDDGIPVVELDERQIHQVLINLVKNAAEAFQEGQTGKKIVLRWRVNQHDRPCLEVQDNGPGMSPELQEKIFVPFYTTKKDGSGIGLNLARQIMLQHRGRIGLSSALGDGTTFRLEF